jgi:predicted ester cyclase
MSSAREAYERSVQLYNAGDLEGIVNSFTEDGVLVTPYGTFEGRAAIREFSRRDIAAFPERTVAMDVIVEQGDTIADEFTFVAMNTGPFVMPDGTELPPTGKRVEVKGMELLQMRDGKIAAHHMYWDSMAVIRQLGLLPDSART